MWFNIAAPCGDETAVEGGKIVAKRMTAVDSSEAVEIARECEGKDFKNCQ
jgi:hypothetical protein